MSGPWTRRQFLARAAPGARCVVWLLLWACWPGGGAEALGGPPAGGGRGFPVIAGRGDGSGSFPDDCTPVTNWREYTYKWVEEKAETDDGKVKTTRREVADKLVLENIVWRVPLPNMGQGVPICVGRKVFVTCEPGWRHAEPLLLCVDADSGKLLWQREVDHFDLLPADEQAEAKAVRKRFWEKHRIAWRMNYDASIGGVEVVQRLKRRAAELDIGIGTGWRAGYGYPGRFSKIRDSDGIPFTFAVDGNKGARGGSRETSWLFRSHRWRMPSWHQGSVGFAYAAPVSDGRCVYVANTHRVLACYDLDGNLVWMRWHRDALPNRSDLVSAPILTGWPEGLPRRGGPAGDAGMVLVCWDDTVTGAARLGGNRYEVWAYDKASGETLWSRPIRTGICAPMLPLRLTSPDGRRRLDVVVAEDGTVLRLRDGEVLTGGIGKAAPVNLVTDGVDTIFLGNGTAGGHHTPGADQKWAEQGIIAVKLALTQADEAAASLLWRAKVTCGSAALVFHKGVLYVFKGGGCAALDAKTGQVLAREAKGLARYDGYATAAAGKHLFQLENEGKCCVLQAAPEMKVVSRPRLEMAAPEGEKKDQVIEQTGKAAVGGGGWFGWHFGRTAPFLTGNRIFIRSMDYLYCIGKKDEPFRPSKAFAAAEAAGEGDAPPEAAQPGVAPEPDKTAAELIADLQSGGLSDRIKAAEALGRMGPRAAEAVEALTAALGDPYWDVRQAASEALRRIGPAAVPALVKTLKAPHFWPRTCAARTLGRIGPAARDAVVALAEEVGDPSQDMRCEALYALVQIRDIAPAASQVAKALDDPAYPVRDLAIRALWLCGKDAMPAAVKLLKGTLRKDWDRYNAVLNGIGHAGAAAVPMMLELLGKDDAQLQVWAATGLRHMGSRARPAVPVLLGLLKTSTNTSVRAAIVGLLPAAAPAEQAMPLLIEALGDADATVAAEACGAVARMGTDAIPALVKVVREGKMGARMGAVGALKQFGPRAAEAAPALREAVKGQPFPVQLAIRDALKAIAPDK